MNISDDALFDRLTEIPREYLPDYPLPPGMRMAIDGLTKDRVRYTVFEVDEGDGTSLLLVPHTQAVATMAEIRAVYFKSRMRARRGEV